LALVAGGLIQFGGAAGLETARTPPRGGICSGNLGSLSERVQRVYLEQLRVELAGRISSVDIEKVAVAAIESNSPVAVTADVKVRLAAGRELLLSAVREARLRHENLCHGFEQSQTSVPEGIVSAIVAEEATLASKAAITAAKQDAKSIADALESSEQAAARAAEEHERTSEQKRRQQAAAEKKKQEGK
jgi:hypothetical protein